MSITVKAFLQKPGEPKSEIRRFTIPVDVSTNFTYLERKVAEIFPNLKRADLELQWQDPDGDLVVFSSDEELIGALSFRKDDVFRVYVREKDKKTTSGTTEGEVHPGVVCDGCNSSIRGARYKCCICPDYDLCSTCNMQGIHEEHEMFKIPKPKEMGPAGPWGFAFGGHHPPPYFRRWMNRYMRRWHKNNDCKNKEEQPESNEEKSEQEQEEDYLKGVGENIAAMLDPFGIDVHVDVDHDGERTHCGPPRGWGPYGGCFGYGGGRGKWRGKRCCKGKGKKCEKEECKNKCNKDESVDVQQKVADMDINTDGVDGPETGPMVDQDMKEFEWTLLKTEESSSESDKNDKTEEKSVPKPDKQEENDVEEDGEDCPQFPGYPHLGPSPHPGHPPHPHMGPFGPFMGQPQFMGGFPGCVPPRDQPHGAYPFPGFIPPQHPPHGAPHATGPAPAWPKDPKIGEPLLQMLQMGFNNENGWITHLLEENDGDIGKVLDAIKAGHRPDGRMA